MPRTQWNDPNFMVLIQQDGAKAHTGTKFQESWFLTLEDLCHEPHPEKVKLCSQPPNSPDLNVNNLGLFNALQAMHWRTAPKDALDLMDKVNECHKKFPVRKINHVFLSLQACMNKIIDAQGCNHHKTPHLSKEKLKRDGCLPSVLEVTPFAASFVSTLEDTECNPVCEEDFTWQDDDLPGRVTRAELRGLRSSLIRKMNWKDEWQQVQLVTAS